MYAVLGATGKVGRTTIARLRQSGRAVRAISRDRTKLDSLLAGGCEWALADLEEVESLVAALQGVSAVQLIIPMATQAEDAFAVTNKQIDNLIAALPRTTCSHVLAISDYGAHQDGPTGVTRLFHQLEGRLRELDLGLTLLRSAEHMENWARLLGFAKASGVLPSMHQPLDKLFPTISAFDVGGIAADLLLDEPPPDRGSTRVVHAEGPRRYTPRDVAASMSDVLGRSVSAQLAPRSGWLPGLLRGGLGRGYAELVVELYDAHNAGWIDVEPNGEVRRGATSLDEALRRLA